MNNNSNNIPGNIKKIREILKRDGGDGGGEGGGDGGDG